MKSKQLSSMNCLGLEYLSYTLLKKLIQKDIYIKEYLQNRL